MVKVNAANYTVYCTGLSGSVSFNPALTPSGTGGVTKDTGKVNATLSGCVATPKAGGSSVTISSATISGKLKYKTTSFPANVCSIILAGADVPFKGSLTVTWSSTPALKSPTSVLKVSSEAVQPFSGPGDSTYTIPGTVASSVTGSFTGGNLGIDSVLQVVGADTPEQLGEGCVASGGLKSLPLASGYLGLGAPPTSIAVTPGNDLLAAGRSDSDNALGTFGGGTQVDISAASTWSSSAVGVATVTGGTYQSNVQAVGAGTTTISAKFGGITGSTGLTVVPDLVITTMTVPDGTVGSSYDQTLAAQGGTTPYTWSLALGTLPNGLNLDPSTGEITGMPTAAGCSLVTVEVQDSSAKQQTSTLNMSFGVDGGDTNGCLVSTTTSLPDGVLGQPYDETVAGAGGTAPYTFSDVDSELPSWASLNTSTGEITGTPNATGNGCFILQVTDSSSPQQEASSEPCIHVGLQLTTTELPNGNEGTAYDQTLQTAGGVGPYTWSDESEPLPGWASLNASTGEITGTPNASGTVCFEAMVTDSESPPQSDEQSLCFGISSPGLQITTTSFPTSYYQTYFSQTVQATGGTTPYTWSGFTGSGDIELPFNLTLNESTGLVTGDVNDTGSGCYDFDVTDHSSPAKNAFEYLCVNVEP
jgi:hypothetical protein